MKNEIKGAILADTVYREGVLVAEDVAVTLPSITHQTFDLRAMGTLSVPLYGLLDAMEASFTKVGVDKGLKDAVKMGFATYEIRWAQPVIKPDGSSSTEGCKAFLRAAPKAIPGLSVDPGNSSENEISLSVSRYQLFVSGKEYWNIDQLNGILRVDGVDYYKNIRSAL